MGKGIKHTSVGSQLTQAEFEDEASHYLASGTSFPISPSEGDLFYRTDEHKWYIYNGTEWQFLGATFPSGTSFPASPSEGDRFYRTDVHRWYVYNGSTWVNLSTVISTIASDTLQFSNDTERHTASATYVKLKEILINEAINAVRIKFDLKVSAGSGIYVYGRIYKNGVAMGTERSTTSTSYVTFSEDFAGPFVAGDLIQLYGRKDTVYECYVRNLRLYWDISIQWIASPTSQDP